MNCNTVSKMAVRKLYERYVKSRKENFSLKKQITDFQAVKKENDFLREENEKLHLAKQHLCEENKALCDEQTRCVEESKTSILALQGEIEALRDDLNKTKLDYKQELENNESSAKAAELKEKKLLTKLVEVHLQNEGLHKKIVDFEANNATQQKQSSNFIAQYFSNQCLDALETFEEGEQNILVRYFQHGFDPRSVSAFRASKLEDTNKLRVNCLKKVQNDKHVESFDKLLLATKSMQFKLILALHDSFSTELKRLDSQAKMVSAMRQRDVEMFKKQISDRINGIQAQTDSMDFGSSKFFQKFLSEKFFFSNSTQSILLNQFREHAKHTQSTRLPIIRSAISSLFSDLEGFQLKSMGIGNAHVRFLQQFASLEKFR